MKPYLIKEMKIIFSCVLGLFLFFCPTSVQAKDFDLMPQEEIAKAPALDPITEAEINNLLGEDPYIGETDWRGNKISPKRDYSKKKEAK